MKGIVWLKHILSLILGIFFINVGIGHFVEPEWFEPIVPKSLGDPTFWVYASGFFEIILGIAVALPWYRKEAALGLVVMLVILYWANLNMWVNDIPLNGRTYATHWHVLRGIGQFVLIWIALRLGGWESGQRLVSWIRSE